MSDDPRVTVPADEWERFRDVVMDEGGCFYEDAYRAARALVDAAERPDEGETADVSPEARAAFHVRNAHHAVHKDDAKGWVCTTCGWPDFEDAPPVPVNDEAEADPRDDETIKAAWTEWERNMPERFWDVAVWIREGKGEPNARFGSLDVANRFEIWAHGFRAARGEDA